MLLAVVLLALANPGGITSYSGKQGGNTCNQCHAGGTAPTVAITGPSTLMPGASATYTVTISGGAAVRAGLNAAVSGGTLIAGSGTQVMGGEVTHSAPGMFNAGTAAFSFTLTAPATSSTLRLYVAGLSASGGNAEMGDMDGSATLEVQVGDAVMQAPMPPTPVSVRGAQPGAVSGGVVEGGCSVTGGLPLGLLALAGVLRRKWKR